MKVTLDGTWKVLDMAHSYGEPYAKRVSADIHEEKEGIPAQVPGMVTDDLLAVHRISDPNWNNNVLDSRWIDQKDWIYWREFELPKAATDKQVWLKIGSMDLYGRIYINGQLVGRHENQFRRFTAEVSKLLKPGPNRIAICLEAMWPATLNRVGTRHPHWNNPWERLFVRRSQMAWGWDWAAGSSMAGITRSVELEILDEVLIGDCFFATATLDDCAVAGRATLDSEIEIRAAKKTEVTLVQRLGGKEIHRSKHTLKVGMNTLKAATKFDKIKYWYAWTIGDPALHKLETLVLINGKTAAQTSKRIGFRTVKLVTRDKAFPNEKVFYFTVNGKKLWLVGENYLPMDFVHTRTQAADYRKYIEMLKLGGVNCMRIWGGGIIEKPEFYEICSELGLLMWHDFMFACGIYPKDEKFLAEIAVEAEDMVRQLRSETCIGIWCGNNENEVLATSLPKPQPEWYRKHPIYYEVLPKVLKKLDPTRPFWHGSPSSESMDVHPDEQAEGDRHNWDCWHGWRRMKLDKARMNTEYGAMAFPQREMIEAFMHVDDIHTPGVVNLPDGPSPGNIFARHGLQAEKLFAASIEFGAHRTTDGMIAASQMYQAHHIGSYMRHYRVEPYTGGVIIWNYTSVWPSICWAVTDYCRRPKQAFYAIMAAAKPDVVGIEPTDTYDTAFLVRRTGEGQLRLRLVRVADGKTMHEEKTDGSPITYKPDLALIRRQYALVGEALDAKGKTVQARTIYYLAQVRDMEAEIITPDLQEPSQFYIDPADHPRILYKPSREPITVTYVGPKKLRFKSVKWRLRVGVETLEPQIWNDNYFDLMPGETREIELIDGTTLPRKIFIVADNGTRKMWLPTEEKRLEI